MCTDVCQLMDGHQTSTYSLNIPWKLASHFLKRVIFGERNIVWKSLVFRVYSEDVICCTQHVQYVGVLSWKWMLSQYVVITMSQDQSQGGEGMDVWLPVCRVCVCDCVRTVGCSPVNIPLAASTGPVLSRCWQHRPSTGPVLTNDGMFTGNFHYASCQMWLTSTVLM